MRKAALLLAAVLLSAPAIGQDWRGPAAIAVQVEDAKGRNLAGAEVLLVYLSPDGGGSLPSVLTDGSGQANIGGLAAGRWSVEVRHAGHMSYRAELAVGAESKPSVLSASHLMAPGASSTMKVKFSRGRAGATVPAGPVTQVATSPPTSRAPESVVAAVTPEPAPAPVAPAPAPVRELAPVPTPRPVPPAPAPEEAPEVKKAPVKEVVPAPPPVAPAPKPMPVPAPAAPAVKPPTPPAMPSPAPVVPSPAETKPPAPAVPLSPPPSAPPVPAPVVAASPPSPAAPAAPAPPAQPGRARLCVECSPGESAAWGEAAIEGGAKAGCPEDLPARLKSVELGAVGALSADLAGAGLGCRVVAVELPAGARFTGYRYEAQSAGVAADCLPGRGCPAGGCRFPNEPVLRQEGNRTVLLVGFESTAPDLRRAVIAGYSTYTKR